MTELIQAIQGSGIVYRLGWTLVHSLWLGAAVGVAFAVAMLLLRRRSANLRYLAGCAALVLMVAALAGTFLAVRAPTPTRSAAIAQTPVSAAAGHTDDPTDTPPVPTVASADPHPQTTDTALPNAAPLPAVRHVVQAKPAAVEQAPWTTRARQAVEPALAWVVLGWAAGVMALSVWQLAGCIAASRLKRLATQPGSAALIGKLLRLSRVLRVSRPVRLLESMLVRVPTVIGWLRPVILLPVGLAAGLTPQQVEAILAHELAHVRRYDYLVNLLQTLVETLLFYHPAVWFLSRRLRAEREKCCDDVAVRAGAERFSYAESLIHVLRKAAQRPLRMAPALGAAPLRATGRASELRSRIVHLLGAGPAETPRNWPAAAAVLAGIAILATVLVSVWAGPAAPAKAAGKDANAATTQPATRPNGPPWEVALPNGVTVELIGLADSPSVGKAWWGPDGRALPDRPYSAQSDPFGGRTWKDRRAVELAYRVLRPGSGEGATFLSTSGNLGLSTVNPKDKQGEPIHSVNAEGILFPKDQETTNIRIGAAAGPWRTAASGDFDSNSGAIQNTKVLEPHGYLELITPPQGAKDIILAAVMHLSWDDLNWRFVAEDKAGKIHRLHDRDITDVRQPGQPLRIRHDLVFEEATPPRISDLAKLLLEVRSFHYAEFQNIPLQGGRLTELRIVTGIRGALAATQPAGSEIVADPTAALKAALPEGLVIQREESNSAPFYLEPGNGRGFFIGKPLDTIGPSEVKVTYSMVVWIMPSDYAGRDTSTDPHRQTWAPPLAAVARNGRIYVWPGSQNQIDLVRRALLRPSTATQPATQPKGEAYIWPPKVQEEWVTGLWMQPWTHNPGPTEPNTSMLVLNPDRSWASISVWGDPNKPSKAEVTGRGPKWELKAEDMVGPIILRRGDDSRVYADRVLTHITGSRLAFTIRSGMIITQEYERCGQTVQDALRMAIAGSGVTIGKMPVVPSVDWPGKPDANLMTGVWIFDRRSPDKEYAFLMIKPDGSWALGHFHGGPENPTRIVADQQGPDWRLTEGAAQAVQAWFRQSPLPTGGDANCLVEIHRLTSDDLVLHPRTYRRASPELAARLAAATPPATQPAADKAEIERLIQQLGSERTQDRETAHQALVRIGKPALDALQAATKDKDVERASRAKAAIAEITATIRRASRFAIYLVSSPSDLREAQKLPLERLELEPDPVYADEDVVTYDWAEHILHVMPEAKRRVTPIGSGYLPFVVMAGGERCYLGAFFRYAGGYDALVPLIPTEPNWNGAPKNALRILANGKADDPRGDPRVRKALEAAGKLKAGTQPATQPAADAAEIGRLVKQLGSDDAEQRDEARKALAQVGEAALPGLSLAAKGEDPLSRRALDAIAEIMKDRVVQKGEYLCGQIDGMIAPDHKVSVSMGRLVDGNGMVTLSGLPTEGETPELRIEAVGHKLNDLVPIVRNRYQGAYRLSQPPAVILWVQDKDGNITPSRPAATQPAYPLWDGKQSVADYAKRSGIKDAQLTLALDGNVTMKLTLIPPGKFMMGSPEGEKDRSKDEGPQHDVTISKPFYMGVYSVTQEQYEQVMGKNPSNFKGAQNPVETVSWEEAVEFSKKLSQKTGKAVSLPTEAQWEYACRAGSKTRFSFGDDDDKLGDYAWYSKNNESKTHAVGQKKPNDWGLYDMHGNVWQWCADWYADSYANAKNQDPQGPDSGSDRVLRGGCWSYFPYFCRSARRDGSSPDHRNFIIGFRVSVDLPAARPVESSVTLTITPAGAAARPATQPATQPAPAK